MLEKISASNRLNLGLLDETERVDIKRTLERLYLTEKMSTNDISFVLGKSQSFAWALCKRLGIALRSPDEGKAFAAPWRIKTLRRSFNGSEENRCYLKGFSEGDLDVRAPSTNALMVSSTTTHPAFASCFRELFQEYGPVYEYPVYDRVAGYKWKAAARLDNSFSFLLPSQRRNYPAYSAAPTLFYSWLAGIVDSDGSIVVERSGAYVKLVLLISNQNQSLISHIKNELLDGGYHPTGPYLQAKGSAVTQSWKIRYSRDLWQLLLQRADEVRDVLKLLPLRHSEKILRREMALSIPPAAKWEDCRVRVAAMTASTRLQVGEYVSKSRAEYKRRDRGQAI